MSTVPWHYMDIRDYRNQKMKKPPSDSIILNEWHDDIMRRVVHQSLELHASSNGPPPSSFCFFVMGSAGRQEQGIWSDQDHGIIYEQNTEEAKQYFVSLGEEISNGLAITGYRLCDGKVMASNPFWCRSLAEWKGQVDEWTNEDSWESIRYLLTFLDGRCLVGQEAYIEDVKRTAYRFIHEKHLINRILENTMHAKKAVNMLGQFLVETHGTYTGLLNIKETGLFPYVNAGRLLAISGNLMATSTRLRLQELPPSVLNEENKEKFSRQFLKLQKYRLLYGDHTDYESGHYIYIDRLSKAERKELKDLIKDGQQLNEYVRKFAKKEGHHGNE